MKIDRLIKGLNLPTEITDLELIEYLISKDKTLEEKEYYLTLKALWAAVHACSKQGDELVSAISAKPFVDFLTQRFGRFDQTDVASWIVPGSKANQLCASLAIKLSSFLKVSPIKLLMPSIKSTRIDSVNKSLQALEPHEWILGSDHYPIHITSCLVAKAKNKDNRLMSTCQVDGNYYALHQRDAEMVMQHTVVKEKRKPSSFSVEASYGEAGKRRLQLNILRDLLAHVQLSDWYRILFVMDTAIVEDIAFEGIPDRSDLTAKKYYKGNDRYDKAKHLALVLCKARALHERSSRYSGVVFSIWSHELGFGVDKDDKIKLINDIYVPFILSNNYSLDEIGQYVKDNYPMDHVDMMKMLNDYIPGIKESELYKIVKLANDRERTPFDEARTTRRQIDRAAQLQKLAEDGKGADIEVFTIDMDGISVSVARK